MNHNIKKEFSEEVAMLDKFKNDYIIHFYGACFIPNKICLVTEYAPLGSLQDVMNNQRSSPPTKQLRLKILIFL